MGILGMKSHGPYGGLTGVLKSLWYIAFYSYIFVPWYIVYEWFVGNKKLDLTTIPKRPGQVVVITGCNRGVGAATVKMLLKLGMHVVSGVRKIDQMNQVVDAIRESGIKSGTIDIFYLDLCDLESVRIFATEVSEKYPIVHCLINNAAVMNVPYIITVSGFEQQFQVNYLGPFLLTNLLLPNIIQASSEGLYGIILDVSSIAQYSGKLDFDNLNSEKWYNCMAVYGNTKKAQTCANHYLGIKLKQEGFNVRTANVHPGVLGTGLWNTSFWYKGIIKNLYQLIIGTAENGANEVIFAAFHPDIQHETGMYYNYRKSDPKSPKVPWPVIEKLWELSCKMVEIENIFINNSTMQNGTGKCMNNNDGKRIGSTSTSTTLKKSLENLLSNKKRTSITPFPLEVIQV